MRERFKAEGAAITDVFYCPYHPEYGVGQYMINSFDRKPNPGMLLRAAEQHRLDMGNSVMVGDKDSDMQVASMAKVGIRCHYLAGDAGVIVSDVATHKNSLAARWGYAAA